MATQNLHKGPLTDSKWVWRSLRGTAQTTERRSHRYQQIKGKAIYPHSPGSWVIISAEANLSSLLPPQLFLKYSPSFFFLPMPSTLPSHLPICPYGCSDYLLSKTLPSNQCFFLIILSPLFTTIPTKSTLYVTVSLQPPVHPNFKPL